ncbi:translocation/assembly module TamB domain-containing protein [Halopseudomonas bauzanensis]|uniref:translocation/assembly module TamB domain-containing protein n=1 Tax=Halopseudomonas bauzanensis TaxID=653930 RepID=UPI0025533308|nr:translocation/assembly module TamB domain-containing protein [Halopseudomonas bauzanensis]
MTGFLLKALLRGLLILLVVPLLLVAILLVVLSSEGANRWLFTKLPDLEPRLQLEFSSGQLWQGWHFSQVTWRDTGIELTIDELELAWSPGCLRGKRLCIDLLAAERIDVRTIPTDEPDEPRQNITLPEVRLPLGVQLQEARIGQVWVNGGEEALLRDISLQAQLSDDQLHISHFTGQGPDLTWDLEGDLRMSGDWPLRVTSALTLPPVDDRSWQLQARLGGSVAQLQLEAHSSGYLPGVLTANIQPLAAELPLTAQWRGESFLALESLPPSLTLNDLVVNLAGDLEEGIALQAASHLPGEGGRIDLTLHGLARTTGVSDLNLHLGVAEQPERELRLTANAGWSDVLTADAQLAMQQFPWQWLYPQDIGPVEVHQLTLDANLRDMAFDAALQAQLGGVGEQEADLQLALSGTPEHIDIAPLALTTEQGSLTGEAALNLLNGIAWDVSLLLQELNPQMFVAELPGSLNGPITSSGSIRNEELQLNADWDLSGTLRRQPLALSGAVASAEDGWQVTGLELRQGDNRINGAGHWGQNVEGRFDINLAHMATLWPGLSGSLVGNARASGSANQPTVTLALQGERIGYAEFGLAALTADGRVTLNDQLPGNLTLSATRLRNGDTRLGDLSLVLDGTRASHQLAVDLQGGMVDLDTRLTGSLNDERWQGQLRDASIAAEEMVWQLNDPAVLSYRLANGELRLGAHCWSHLQSQLCFIGEQRLMPDRQVNLRLDNFPLASLQEWLPDDLIWDATLNAEAQFRQAVGAEPRANVVVSSRNGELRVSNPDQQLTFPYENLEFTAQLDPDQARSRLQLVSEGLGNLDVQADIADPGGAQRLDGRFDLREVQLDILRPFLPQVDTLGGDLIGRGTLAGTLTEPLVEGDILLTNGEISGPELPVSFEQLRVQVGITGQQAVIDGQWRSGEGQGQLAGTAAWAPDLAVDISLTGTDLPIRVDPYADLLASPDLHIGLADNNLALTGTIAIPEGDITVRELPPAAVRVSPDAEIVGATEEMEESLPLGISMGIQLLIGDQLNFSGFGLTGRLSGQLHVRENMTAAGNLNILDGRFRGYGQRLELRRAQILFAGPISKPYLDIEAIRRVDDVIAGLRLTGQADAPISEVFSEPTMAQEQALAYLILGRPLGADTGDSNVLGQAALALGMAGSTPLAKNIAGSLGIDDFQLDTEGSGLTTSVVATGYLTEKLSLRYGVGVFEQANRLAVRYDLTKRLYLEAVGGLASSLDFFYRIDF